MRALFYHPGCGISGDMNLAALLQLGVPMDYLEAQLTGLGLAGQYRLETKPGQKMGIHGLQVRVLVDTQHHHRHYSDIVAMIRAAGLSQNVETRALAMFRVIAEAEAQIHQVPIDTVHFHEVGALDSIVDIVGAAICLDYLAVEAIYSSPIEVGGGYVDCAHGRLPVPAPATQEILQTLPCTYAGVTGECTTPTGAAILRASITHPGVPALFTPTLAAYAIGHKDFERPNVLRVVLGEIPESTALTDPLPTANGKLLEPVTGAPYKESTHYKIEANIDDMTAEALAPLVTSLLDAGASDAYSETIVMKKSRTATCLNVLTAAETLRGLVELIFNQTTTIGLRVVPFQKFVLDRAEQVLATDLGAIRIKQVRQPDGRTRWKSEHDDVLNAARKAGVDYLQAKTLIDFAIEQQLREKFAKDTDLP